MLRNSKADYYEHKGPLFCRNCVKAITFYAPKSFCNVRSLEVLLLNTGTCIVCDIMCGALDYDTTFIATQLNSTQLNCQLSIRWRRVGGSERRDPVEVVCGSLVTSCMMQNSHEIREFVWLYWLYDRIDSMES